MPRHHSRVGEPTIVRPRYTVDTSRPSMLRPPGPKPHFLIGNLPLAGKDPLATFLAWAREFGDIFYYRAGWLKVYFLNHPDLIESVLVKNYQNFLKDRVVRNSRWFFGEGLLTNEGESWRRQRRLSQPAFHRERVSSYADVMTDYTRQMLANWRDGEVRDVHQEMMQLTLRVVVRCLFSVEADEIGEVSRSMNTVMRNTTGLRMLLPPSARYIPLPSMIEFRGAVDRLDKAVYRIIEARRRDERDAGDLLSMLIKARDEDGSRMSAQQLRDEVLTFLLAGHETTALALSWAWHLLGQHPQVKARLEDELETKLKGRVPEFSDLPALSYSERVLKEVLRLYPPAWSLARTVISDFDLRGYTIPAGANVVMSQWIMHRDSRYFREPERFDPDRWLDPAMQKLPRFAYFPFGGGPRQCIGASFATMEALLILTTVAQRFRFEPVPGHELVPTASFTLRPRHGIRMKLAARSNTRSQYWESPVVSRGNS